MSQHPSKPGGVFNKKNKWLLWVGVILMILAMVAYVATLDESEVPGRGGEPVPEEAP
ncbi:hypothetical protein [Haloferula sp.]|uniref:hypothetical protein n=1 Tax=Haloferula sp. TaxID=2497595 RepID=UPI003C760259